MNTRENRRRRLAQDLGGLVSLYDRKLEARQEELREVRGVMESIRNFGKTASFSDSTERRYIGKLKKRELVVQEKVEQCQVQKRSAESISDMLARSAEAREDPAQFSKLQAKEELKGIKSRLEKNVPESPVIALADQAMATVANTSLMVGDPRITEDGKVVHECTLPRIGRIKAEHLMQTAVTTARRKHGLAGMTPVEADVPDEVLAPDVERFFRQACKKTGLDFEYPGFPARPHETVLDRPGQAKGKARAP